MMTARIFDLPNGLYWVSSCTCLIESMPVWVAASISSRSLGWHPSRRAPMRARVVFPVPEGPDSKNARDSPRLMSPDRARTAAS